MSADVHAVARTFHDGIANRDASAIAELYHDDARLLPPNMEPSEGRAAIEATFQQLVGMASSLDIEPLDVREGGDLTVEYGRYTLGLAEGGTDVGKYIVVHEARPEGTKILLDIFNSNSPPPA